MAEISSTSMIQRSWIVDGHLMLITMPEILTAASLQAHDLEVWNILEASESSFVHFLTDSQALRVYPSLADYMSQKSLRHPNLGWFMSVGAVRQPLLRFFLTTVMSAARVRYRDFNTMYDALVFARDIDNALAGLVVTK